jgi:dTDP-4-amino-4,6-dideoxygalactose transaminase
MGIPLVDLKWQHAQVAEDIKAGMADVMANTAFILGPQVGIFERAFAGFQGSPYCVGVGSGTDALELGLRALGVGPGDEVIAPANTFIATVLAATRCGATPVLVDCDPVHYLIDPDQVEAAITPRTKAIIPVHLYGQLAPMAPILEIAERHGVAVLEDAAQAHGARQDGKLAGHFGAAAAFSFYPGKNLGAYGDAGAVTTTDPAVHELVLKLRNWGSGRKYYHPEKGFNSRLDTIQAVVLSAKLDRLAEWNSMRQIAADRYVDALEDVAGIQLPSAAPGNEHVWHLYVVRVPERDAILAALNEAGVGAGIHYPIPIHLQGAYAELGQGHGTFPVTETAAGDILSLPMFQGITMEQQRVVANTLRGALRSVQEASDA